MGLITLEGLEFFAYHGFYDEERKIGNKYSVDIQVEAVFKRAAEKDEISGTVNYEDLYKLVKAEMERPSKLLENVAKRMIDATFHKYPNINSVEIKISKFNPPIGGICKNAKITLKEVR